MKTKGVESEATEVVPTERRLVLKKRTIATLSDDQLADAAGGHDNTCRHTCPRTGCTCHATCMGEASCDAYYTCGTTCRETCDGADTCTPPP